MESSPLSWRLSKERLKLASSEIKGVIESFTVVYNAPKGYETNAPYAIALVRLANGEKMTSQIVDADRIEVGMKVEPCLRKVFVNGEKGLIEYGTKFRIIQ